MNAQIQFKSSRNRQFVVHPIANSIFNWPHRGPMRFHEFDRAGIPNAMAHARRESAFQFLNCNARFGHG